MSSTSSTSRASSSAFANAPDSKPAWDPRDGSTLEALRHKWQTVPGSVDRVRTGALAALSDAELLAFWRRQVADATTGESFAVRGWYHELYKDVLRNKRVLDVGAGLGIDALTFAPLTAHITLLDIVRENVANTTRLSRLLGCEERVTPFYMQDLGSLSDLGEFDVIWCQGSLINAPFGFVREEIGALLEHLPIGGRWVELAYPRERWEREGSLPFEQWGAKTDGPGTPWVEWYDLEKLQAALAPAEFDVILAFNFHNDDFNWFDLVRRV